MNGKTISNKKETIGKFRNQKAQFVSKKIQNDRLFRVEMIL